VKPDLYIARRYLVARKSLGVIHAISLLSAIGMAVGTAALILILSVYNGFDNVIKQNLSDLAPDVLVTPAHGKFFVPEGPAFEALKEDPRIARVCSVVEEQVFAAYGGRQELVRAARILAEKVRAGEMAPEDIDEQALSDCLYTGGLPDVDLLQAFLSRMHPDHSPGTSPQSPYNP